jgi:YidC/Oxa1 family membrane protein insertase
VAAGVPQHPPETVVLGSLNPDSGFFLNVQLSSLGAAIDFIELNDPRYPEFGNRKAPLKVVGSDPKVFNRTFATEIPELDHQLPPGGNQKLHWELVKETRTDSAAEFRLVSPDGGLEVVKRYELKKPKPEALRQPKARDHVFEGYELVLTITFHNLKSDALDVDYVLQGPVSLPLEDAENSSKYRDIRMGFLEPGGRIERGQMSATDVVDKDMAGKIEVWKRPLKYIGIDVKYFAALVEPLGDQLKSQTVASYRAQLISPHTDKKFSDISVLLDSTVKLPAAGADDQTVAHQYLLFTGPKRQDLLAGVSAEAIVDFGYVDIIARFMLWILNLFHSLGASYGVAIILLTVVVRMCMFPVSRHQAHNMQRMKELQPKIKELQAKHATDKEGLARAQMELFRKHNYNPLSGCLPLFLQLPIFIGLYTALSSSVDLRMAKFLWIDNLASPDALFKLGFVVPFFGWTDFNLLPIISTGVMFFQQKMMMPPPADEEQAMQQKMMNYMMIFMGAMFYRVPAGLCIYFIASSVWGMVERWLLNKLAKDSPAAPAVGEKSEKKTELAASEPPAGPSRIGELWNRLQSAADKDVSITRTGDTNPNRNGKKKRR